MKLFSYILTAILMMGMQASVFAADSPGNSYAESRFSHSLKISTEKMILADSSRSKDITVSVVYPQTEGHYPVIVFSHGAGGTGMSYVRLLNYWTSHGYICVAPTHTDSLKVSHLNILQTLRKIMVDYNGWINRTKDIDFVISSLPLIESKIPTLRGKMDLEHIGVGGHSYGAFTSELLDGALIDIPIKSNSKGNPRSSASEVSFADSRPLAFLLLSPQGISRRGLGFSDKEAFLGLKKPTMIMTGSRDGGSRGQLADWRVQVYRYAPPGDKYLVFLQGATHMTFTGIFVKSKDPTSKPVFSDTKSKSPADDHSFGWRIRKKIAERIARSNPPDLTIEQMAGQSDTDSMAGADMSQATANKLLRPSGNDDVLFPYVEIASLAFWDSYLRNDRNARAFLTSRELQQSSRGLVKILNK